MIVMVSKIIGAIVGVILLLLCIVFVAAIHSAFTDKPDSNLKADVNAIMDYFYRIQDSNGQKE